MRCLSCGNPRDSINETEREAVEQPLRIPRTITIRPRFALRVIANRDLILGMGAIDDSLQAGPDN